MASAPLPLPLRVTSSSPHSPLSPNVASQVAIERHFWETDPHERPGVDTVENLVNKAVDVAIFDGIILPYRPLFERASRIVEIGGGQGWASCLVKRRFPKAHVTLTDAVDAAVAGRVIWERVFDTTLDAAMVSPAQAIAVDDASVDLLFCFAAAHHFIDYEAALREAYRVLEPGGSCLWLYEPTSPRFWHARAEARVNAKRVEVPEHVIVPADVLDIGRRVGFDAAVARSPEGVRRGAMTAIYYGVLSLVPALTHLLPCTAHFTFTKPMRTRG